MSEREKLIKQICNEWDIDTVDDYIIDFILADRKRIIEPLVNLERCPTTGVITSCSDDVDKAVDETLELAGINTGIDKEG